MHQQAVLVTGHSTLGGAGAPVGIDDIERLYPTTTAANIGIAYRCANPNCAVPVIAVITKVAKKGRKNSPSSYFRANRSKPHIKGCSRAPVPPGNAVPAPATTVTPASPNRTKIPTAWVDPLARANGMSGGSGSNSTTGTPSSGSQGTRSSNGTGTSQGHSQMVEGFAKQWLSMNSTTQKATPLTAPWNPGGTYYSAFHPIKFRSTIDVSNTGQKLYVGVLDSVVNTATGSVITLHEQNSSGAALEIFVTSAIFLFGAAGSSLRTKLSSLASAPKPIQIFVLGTFSGANKGTLSLSIPHPHYIHIP